ncbi:dienelactone hydrolase family protein [Plantactinospora sp. KBS50]|uniref:dienelactone hydrolase family protein n=1 Tax=Plantactinospora sp. KBS50 TaxID=2024580 RepID=UPI000BAAEA53|nr:dienelactone hydrolase family protein [Plantactinospora sp. KBS50]ASW53351.1 hydrolase [Plantactinospora sp. KBS50]
MQPRATETTIPTAGVRLAADLLTPDGAAGMVLFAHGSGSSRRSPRNVAVARVLAGAGLGAVLVDLLTPQEERVDLRTRELRFDIPLLADRLAGVVDWLVSGGGGPPTPIGLFGASTGAAAALVAAARRPDLVPAVVSRGGRPDLAGADLTRVRAATLLLVGGSDEEVLGLNEQAARVLPGTVELRVIPGATHLFEEPGALAEVARQAADWFVGHLPG